MLTEEIEIWWRSIEDAANKEGEIFKILFGPASYWKFKVLELKKPDSIVSRSYLLFQVIPSGFQFQNRVGKSIILF